MPDLPGIDSPAAARPRVFISYGHADAEDLAVRLENDLGLAGFNAWRDNTRLCAGTSWEAQIEREILGREVLVSLLTPHAVRRPDGVCLDEISFARYNGRRIVPLMVTPCQPPLGIYRLDWIDFQAWTDQARYSQGLERLIRAIASDHDPVQGEHARLLASLEPIDFGIEISRLTRNFTGRQWLFDCIDTWLRTDTTRVFLITGDPGTGKSAVSAKLIARHPSVCASHFCISNLSASRSPFRFACSIAAQLATQIDGYRAALDAVDLEHLRALDASSVWRRVVAEPLAAIGVETPAVIVVDALDEAMGVAGTSIPRLLRDQAGSLPPNLRFIVTTRKDPDVLDSFSGYTPHDIGSAIEQNRADVFTYVNRCLETPALSALIAARGVDRLDLATVLADKADGNFLYVTQAVAAMESGRLDMLHPERFPQGLVGIYQGFFERAFGEGEVFRSFRPLLEVLCAARDALTSEQIAGFLERDRLDVEMDLDRLAAFFPEFEHRYRPYHKSIVDWLSGQAGQSRHFRIDIKSGHRCMAASLMRDFERGKLEPFVLAQLPAHLHAGGNQEAVDGLLGNPDFVLRKAAAGMYQAAIDDYKLAGASELQTVREALILSSHVVASRVNELPAQLRGRLCGFAGGRLVEFVRRIDLMDGAGLFPQTASLTPPGGSLFRIIDTNEIVRDVAIGERRGQPIIASCGMNITQADVRLWDLATGELVGTPLVGHSDGINGVAFGSLSDGTPVIASGGADGIVRLWHVETGEALEPPFGPLDGVILRVTFVEFKGKPAILATSTNGSKLLDPDSRAPTTNLVYGSPAVYATLADGRPVVISASRNDDKIIVVHDAETGQQRGDGLVGHLARISALAVGTLPDGAQVLASGEDFDGTVRLWWVDSSHEPIVFSLPPDHYRDTGAFLDRRIKALAFGEFGGVRCLVSGSGDATVRIYNLETLEEFGPALIGHDFEVEAVACARLSDTGVIVSGSVDGTIRMWTPSRAGRQSMRPAHHDACVNAIAISRINGQPLVVTGSDDGQIRHSTLEGNPVGAPLHWPVSAIRTVTTGSAADGAPIAAAGSDDGTIWIWDPVTHVPLGLPIVATERDLNHDGVWSVRIVGKTIIAAADYRSSRIHRWKIPGFTPLAPLEIGDQADEPVLAIAAGRLGGAPVLVAARQDDSLLIWNLDDGTLMGQPLVGHTGWRARYFTNNFADSIAFGELADGTPIIVCPHLDFSVRVVAAESGREVCPPLTGHIDHVFSARVGLLGGRQVCVSASVDRTLRVWDATTGRQVAAFTADAPVLCCEIDSGTGTIVAGDHAGAIHILKFGEDEGSSTVLRRRTV
ncbi:MAG: TIR domain-containing protein [Acidobacteriota bacterium]